MEKDYRKEFKELLDITALGPPCFTGDRNYYDRLSTYICKQLVRGYFNRILHIHYIIGELDGLEHLIDPSRNNTKPASKFTGTGSPLAGFSHKHYFQTRDIFYNIGVYWGVNFGGNPRFSQFSDRKLESHFGEQLEDFNGDYIKEMVFDGFENRRQASRLTGNWIIFKEYEGKNYYLGLFQHSTPQNQGYDKDTYEILKKNCAQEFPFLF